MKPKPNKMHQLRSVSSGNTENVHSCQGGLGYGSGYLVLHESLRGSELEGLIITKQTKPGPVQLKLENHYSIYQQLFNY